MSYATLADLTDRYASEEITRLADRDEDGIADPLVIERVLTDADAEIDAYLAVRYTLPLPSTPPRLTSLAADIARYRLQDDNPLDEAVARYRQAIDFLREIANGKAALPGAGPTTGSGNFAAYGTRSDDDRIFTRDTLGDF